MSHRLHEVDVKIEEIKALRENIENLSSQLNQKMNTSLVFETSKNQ